MPKNKTGERAVDNVIAYKSFFETVDGKDVLEDLMKSVNFMHDGFDENPYVMARNEGQRSVVSRILTILKQDPKKLREFMKEREEE